MNKPTKLGAELSRLAQKTVEQALKEGVELETRLEVLKVAGNFHIGTTRVKAKDKEDDPDTPTFGNFKSLIDRAGKKVADA